MPLAKRKSRARLEREIAMLATTRAPSPIAAMLADPQARATFAREMRHEIQRRQAARQDAAHRAARPFTVKHLEQVDDRRVRSIAGNYASEEDARALADRLGGWVETRDGRVVYGRAEDP